jgi:hypothetical protein
MSAQPRWDDTAPAQRPVAVPTSRAIAEPDRNTARIVSVIALAADGRGYQIKGRGRFEKDWGEYAKGCDPTSALRIELPPPQAVVVIQVEAVNEVSPPRARAQE